MIMDHSESVGQGRRNGSLAINDSIQKGVMYHPQPALQLTNLSRRRCDKYISYYLSLVLVLTESIYSQVSVFESQAPTVPVLHRKNPTITTAAQILCLSRSFLVALSHAGRQKLKPPLHPLLLPTLRPPNMGVSSSISIYIYLVV